MDVVIPFRHPLLPLTKRQQACGNYARFTRRLNARFMNARTCRTCAVDVRKDQSGERADDVRTASRAARSSRKTPRLDHGVG
jgi:hypothetical protein